MDLPRLAQFLAELKFNNSKAWFDANRDRYAELRQDFVALMGEVIAHTADFDPDLGAVSPKDTLFRINRDVRFAHDKSPYKSTFSAAIGAGGRKSGGPIYYLQFSPNGALAAGGLYGPEAAELRRIRLYTEQYPARAEALLSDRGLKKHFGGLSGDTKLTRFPKGFGGGSELLKYRSFTVGTGFDAEQVPDLPAHIAARFRQMRPLHRFLREALAFREE